ncbi:hypothetical protein CspHIS471_0202980 [Cutaneotrichosporon sp. HIS471]|nr:hypothetical protein CspHIS471_0202980 [Cutaneotrichosporon sp. HIS471]
MAATVRPALPPKPKNVVWVDGDLASRAGSDTPPAHGVKEFDLPAANAEADEYYGQRKMFSRTRTLSNAGTTWSAKSRPMMMDGEYIQRNRRLSHDEQGSAPRRFLVDVEETMRLVLAQEDTDDNCQISIYDSGPKLISLGTASSNAYRSWDVRGNYMLTNLLAELALARDYGRRFIVLDEERLAENPIDRLSRMIKNSFWNHLTRRIDEQGIEIAAVDPKNRSRVNHPIIYIPHGEDEMFEHYQEISRNRPHLKLEVVQLPKHCDDPEYVKSLNERPGILALAMKKNEAGKLEALPFVVPGARFNEMYNWDSYFIALGLLVDDRLDLAMSIMEHFIFQIKHYNKILNGNRTYYLCRAQPPFMTDLALQIFNNIDQSDPKNVAWLKRAIQAAIKDYHVYWCSEPALHVETGLSRYRPKGLGIPPETEASHFTHILQPYAEKNRLSVNDFIEAYNDGTIKEPELDDYFQHDRAVRESGHDTTYRFEGKCADLATIDLNSLLYKYEIDIANAIAAVFKEDLELEDEFDLSPWPMTREAFDGPREKSTSRKQTAAEWYERARVRKERIDKYCWNEGQGAYFDWNCKKGRQERYLSATTFWPMWAGCADEQQALRLVHVALPKLEAPGGLLSGTEESRGPIGLDRPNRQWDWPTGWAPHQIMAWVGLERYGFSGEANRLSYRWAFMIALCFASFSGIVVEKWDVAALSHMVEAEYGNQGMAVRYINREGFGWTNASLQIALQFITTGMRRGIANLVPPWDYFGLETPAMPAMKRREERAQHEAHAIHRRPSSVLRQGPTYEQTLEKLRNLKVGDESRAA